MAFTGLKDHQAQWDQWAQLVCQANLELVKQVPLAILENLENLECQARMEVLAQWVCQGQRVTQELQA